METYKPSTLVLLYGDDWEFVNITGNNNWHEIIVSFVYFYHID